MTVFQLSDELVFPPPALADANGLLAVGGDLSPERLLLAYRLSIFPWFSDGEPILWWSPSPRLIFELDTFKVPRRLARTIRKHKFHLTMDKDFQRVIAGCATAPRGKNQGTWITAEMITAYIKLHELGYAHSVECWQDGKLAGGLYGVALGGAFFGESMFSAVTDSSKVALASLVQQLQNWRFQLLDCQVKSSHLLRLGATEITAPTFRKRLAMALNRPERQGKWSFETG